jgi:hypothetical protein
MEGGALPARFRRRAALAASLGAALLACEPTRDVVASARPELCDGIDNDGNGIIDDVDADGDGLCDCLRIGVFGYPGIWGSIGAIRHWMRARTAPTTILAGQVLTPGLLARFDVLIVQDVRDGVADGTFGQEGIGVGIGRTFAGAEVRALKEWVDSGGGLLALTGFGRNSEENTNINRLLAPFGLSYSPRSILPALAGRSSNPVTHWDAAHPIATGVTQVGVMSGFPVSGGTLVAWEPTQGAYDIGRAVESQRGHVFAWGDEWIEYDSEWSNPAFQVQRLWQNTLKWLTAAKYCQISLQP